MSKVLYHTITIKVPEKQLFIGKNGNVTIVPSLTKTNAITKRLGIPSIILKKDEHILHPEIIEDGDQVNEKDIRDRQKKLKEIKKKLDILPNKKIITKDKLKYALSSIKKNQIKNTLNKLNVDKYNIYSKKKEELYKPLSPKEIKKIENLIKKSESEKKKYEKEIKNLNEGRKDINELLKKEKRENIIKSYNKDKNKITRDIALYKKKIQYIDEVQIPQYSKKLI
jgi:hypothetical protein